MSHQVDITTSPQQTTAATLSITKIVKDENDDNNDEEKDTDHDKDDDCQISDRDEAPQSKRKKEGKRHRQANQRQR